jgi:hypothetical protein
MGMRRILPCLKPTYILPPFLALILVGVWNVSQIRSISSKEMASADLRLRISNSLALGQSVTDSGSRKKVDSAQDGRIDWKRVPAGISDVQQGGETAQLRAMIELQQRLKQMTREELIAALDEVEGLGLSADDRSALLGLILESMIKLDPQYALARFVDEIEADSNGVGWQLASAFGQWAKMDRAGATAWFDQQIAAGKFESRTLDGRSEMRAKFESEEIAMLISSDLDAAGQRLLALPEDQRRGVLEQLEFAELTPDQQRAYANLVRNVVPEDERAGSFANIASQLAEAGTYQSVSSFLDSVQATPGERAVSAKQAVTTHLETLGQSGEINRQAVDEMRRWLDQQAPGQTDSITGKALAEAAQDGGEFDFEEAAGLVTDYRKSSGSDDVLISFLEGYSAHSNLEEAIHLADLIKDPERRAAILNELN